MNHKYLTCTGFGGSGSSVISDLMKEFSNVKSCGSEFEMSLAYAVDGISDLQHYIVDDFERNKTAEGIYRFRRLAKSLSKVYSYYLQSDFDKHINNYLDNIIEVKWKGENYLHQLRYNRLERYLFYHLPITVQGRIRTFFPPKDSYERTAKIKRKLPIELSISEDLFFESTRRLFTNLLTSYDPDFRYEYLCVDQLVPAYNFKRYSKYFDNLRIVVVDRDPRDLYLLNKLFWDEGWIPSGDVDTFIKWYQMTRSYLSRDLEESSNVVLFKFEDFIFNYENTINKVLLFLDIDPSKHIMKREYFNPDVSLKNTKLWEKYQNYIVDIKQIECELGIYCYNY